ncbi:MAG: DoxX family protein [Verrucomicrobiota bacterium]|nr:DoxX family protein [Verrucomicrobiota bacterium]
MYFKFSGHPESVQLFTELGMEPEDRIIIGTMELVACVLLLIPSSVTFGAILGSALMTGAILGNFTVLGWEGERFSLGFLAVVVCAACGLVIYIRRQTVPFLCSAPQNREGLDSEGEE